QNWSRPPRSYRRETPRGCRGACAVGAGRQAQIGLAKSPMPQHVSSLGAGMWSSWSLVASYTTHLGVEANHSATEGGRPALYIAPPPPKPSVGAVSTTNRPRAPHD